MMLSQVVECDNIAEYANKLQGKPCGLLLYNEKNQKECECIAGYAKVTYTIEYESGRKYHGALDF